MGKFFVFCQIQLKFRFWSYKKRWHSSWKFQFEKTRNKKVIAKKPLTNLYEMNSRWVLKHVFLDHFGFVRLYMASTATCFIEMLFQLRGHRTLHQFRWSTLQIWACWLFTSLASIILVVLRLVVIRFSPGYRHVRGSLLIQPRPLYTIHTSN